MAFEFEKRLLGDQKRPQQQTFNMGAEGESHPFDFTKICYWKTVFHLTADPYTTFSRHSGAGKKHNL